MIHASPPHPGPTRRRLLTTAGAATLSAAVGGPASGDQAVGADVPRSGGTLRLGLGGGSSTDGFNPLVANDSVMIAANFGLFNGLVENSADNQPVPELAERFEPRPGAREWVLDLRPGVHFHNGKAFDADDAIYSLNLHRGQTDSGVAGPMRAITEIRKLGQRQIAITLASGDADFPLLLTDYHIAMVPDGFTDWSRPVGTGAFTVEQFTAGAHIALRKAGPYWKSGRGHLDGVDITVINDTGARMAALIVGRVDAINRADPRTVSRIAHSPGFEIVRAAGGWFPIMAMQTDTAPFTDPDLRSALKHAVDRAQMIKVLFAGYGALGSDHPIPRSDPFYNTDLPPIPYDPERARFHFKRAGLDSLPIRLQASDAAFNGALDMADLFQASAAKAGIAIEIKKEPPDGYFDKIWLRGAFVASYWAGRPAATQMLSLAYRRGASWNETHWSDDTFEQLLSLAQAETDIGKRKAAVWDMQAMLRDRSGSLIPCFRDWLDAHSVKVGGHTPHGGFDMDNGRIAEKAFLRA